MTELPVGAAALEQMQQPLLAYKGGNVVEIVNLLNALPGACAQGLIWGIMAIGVYITYKILDLADLTVDGTMATGGAVCIVMMVNGHSVGVSLLCAFAAGMLAGFVTGILLIGVLYWFFGTELGCSIRATGANPRMSCAQGININFCKILGLMLSNGIVALASGLYAQYQGFADVQAGRGAIVIGLAAVIIGQVVFGKICKNFATRLLAVALGAVIYYLVLQVVLWLGLNANDLKLISAIVVAVFLAIPVLLEKWKIKRAYTEGGER